MESYEEFSTYRHLSSFSFRNGGSFSAVAHYIKIAAGAIIGFSLPKLPLRASCKGSLATDHSTQYDLVVIGGGIVGAATAREVATRQPHLKIALLERELVLASHQSGLNSNVIHAGLYYKPGSLKAKLCVEGSEKLYRYMDEKKIPYKKNGKIVVAVDDNEVPVLNKIYITALQNRVKDVRLITPEEMKLYEPHCEGKAAIRSPHTGVVDYNRVAYSLANDFVQTGGKVIFGFEVDSFEMGKDGLMVIGSKDKKAIRCRNAITCCGLHSDKVAQMTGCGPTPQIIPFRAHYLMLKREKSHLVRGNIYPVPNPDFPFLGAHFTPRPDGSAWLGPVVTVAFSRDRHESYNWNDVKEIIKFKGFRKMVYKHWWYGSVQLYKAAFMRAQVKQLQKYIPELTLDDVTSGPCGTVAQVVNADGTLVEDFQFDQGVGEVGSRVLHVRNAPSPAATSSLAIAQHIADKAQQIFDWGKQ